MSAEQPYHSIEQQVEVPGTPEQVWDAIATGHGNAAWFVPAEIEPREGGAISFDMGSGLEGAGVVTAWDPPRRFAYEEPWEPTGKLATEFLVEAGAGTCVVRVVSSLFAAADAWDQELEQTKDGWRQYLHNLRLYLTHFRGQKPAWIMAGGSTPAQHHRTWAALREALGLPDAAVGERAATTAPTAPTLAGTVEQRLDTDHHGGLMLRLEDPAPGTAFVYAFTYRDQGYTKLHAYLFGPEAPAIAARDEPAWQAWMNEQFPD
jgi:uncharacterized protein YndB with AHSA1/START domain